MDVNALFIFFTYAFSVNCLSTSEICTEVSKFFTNFCDYPLAVKHCSKICNESYNETKLLCGREPKIHSKRYRRIIGGQTGVEGQWPWHISLRMYNNHECGASILSEHFLVTAAHCVDNFTSSLPGPFTVVAGAYNRTQLTEKQQVIQVKRIMKNKGFKIDYHKRADLYFIVATDDLALLETSDSINLEDDNKDRICLPDDNNPIPDNYGCYIVGWGLLKFPPDETDREPNPEILRHAKIRTVPTDVCNRKVSFNNTINGKMTICAGDSNATTSPCNKDSGGGLVCKKDDVWYINGIISSGFKCGGRDAYSLYVNVRYYKTWMLETLFNDTSSTSASSQLQSIFLCIIFSLFIFIAV